MHAVIVLLDDEAAATRAAEVIADVVRGSATVLVPPVRGTAFFADGLTAAAIDSWWGDRVPRDAVPLYVMDFTPGMVPWLQGIDGSFLMRGAPEDLDVAGGTRVLCVHGDALLELAWRVLDEVSSPERGADDEAGADEAGTQGKQATPGCYHAATSTHPFDLLAAAPAPASAADQPSHAAPSSDAPDVRRDVPSTRARSDGPVRALSSVLRLPAWRVRHHGTVDAPTGDIQLASALARRGSTIVAVGSRKGGVGKTSHAAGMAIVAGSVLDAIGHRAVILDANVANPDAWGTLNLPPGAATVRDTVAALDANLDPPRPVHATTPALACYPESRESSEYSRHDVDLLAEHLRRGYTLAVIDLSNRLPDATGGPEAAAAAYWLDHADVVVLPTAWSKQDFNGVLDYLELPDLPPAVVAYIAPRARRHREHPLTQRYLDAITQHACRVVELPDEAESVRYAGLAGLSIDKVSRNLREGYRALTEAVVAATGSPAR